jgi:muramoyltetrapeptide carboxypeptidase LdcA involved in peptidoglycan recycling
MQKLQKLKKGDKVAIVSPSFPASGVWSHVHQLGIERLKNVFGLEPVEYPAMAKVDATVEEKAQDLVLHFLTLKLKLRLLLSEAIYK